ncbi:MAG: sulfatase [Kiritimatiellales bacterium]|jgi:arylsulfatase A-like enzyme
MKHIVTSIAVASAVSGSLLAAETAKPNIIFILADDLGWADLGCYGSTFHETPNLDRLAAQGMRFTGAYAACSVCSPTRASIMTGKYPARLHLTDWLPGQGARPNQKLSLTDFQKFLPLEEFTVAEALKAGGYQTALIGKWHLGENAEYYPEHQGFDLNVAGSGHGHPPSYFSPYKLPNLPDSPQGEYLNDRLTDEAMKFIEQSKDRPFFLYLPHYAVHQPLQAKAAVIEKYKTKAAQRPAGKEAFMTDLGCPVRQTQDNPVYAAMIESLDENVGRLLDKLTALGLDKNTVIIFTSDNGGLSTGKGTPACNLPLRMGKGWPYEGGIREPLIVKWPGVTKPGGVNNAPVISTDYYPTLLQIAGLPPLPEQHLDGKSIVPLLQDGTRPERPLFWHYPHYGSQGGAPNGAVRLGDFKLIEWYEDMRVELYNLKDDIGEHSDLAAKLPAKTEELRKLLHDWRDEVKAQMPVPNPRYRPNSLKNKTTSDE